MIIMFRTAFPDLHCIVEDEINEGHKSAAHWTMRGTHQGPFLGNPPTGRPIIVQGIIFAHIENGRITEDWINEEMPWKYFGQMSDEELGAVWLYLQSLPALDQGN